MDSVLSAMENYRLNASPDRKETDLNHIEKECLTTVDAYQYFGEKPDKLS